MKSRISFFDKTVFRKNLTRFAPVWGLYTVCMFMGLFLMIRDSNISYLPSNMGESVQIMAVITPCYALLVAQLLFGDLFNSRMCNALHALPLRRETWYMTNLASGFVFHLIPTAAMAVVATAVMAMRYRYAWIMGMAWLLGVNLQYLLFFGIGVFSALCTGSRFAMTVVYIIGNFGALLVGWMVEKLYLPLLYGLKMNWEPFHRLSPMVWMVQDVFVDAERKISGTENAAVYTGDNFCYYFICAGIGLVLLAVALELYRRRRLEVSGDFMAIRCSEPVFLVIYSLMVGAVFAFVVEDVLGTEDGLVFLFLGLAVGWFTGRMLLQRSIRVFRKRDWMGMAALMAGFGVTLMVTAADPLGIESWMPEAEQVESVAVTDGHYYPQSQILLEDPAEIQKVLKLHEKALEEQLDGNVSVNLDASEWTAQQHLSRNSVADITLTYQLTDGRTVSRYYYIWMSGEYGEQLVAWFSSLPALFGNRTDIQSISERVNQVTVTDTFYGRETYFHDKAQLQGLLAAILADCENGTMAQPWDYHMSSEEIYYWIYFAEGEDTREIRVYSCCENTLNYLRKLGVDVDETIERYGDYKK